MSKFSMTSFYVTSFICQVHVCICNTFYMTSFHTGILWVRDWFSYDKFYLLVGTCQQIYFDNLLVIASWPITSNAQITLTSFLCWPIQTNKICTLTIFSMISALVQKLAWLRVQRANKTCHIKLVIENLLVCNRLKTKQYNANPSGKFLENFLFYFVTLNPIKKLKILTPSKLYLRPILSVRMCVFTGSSNNDAFWFA
jgi:hypothetical protein